MKNKFMHYSFNSIFHLQYNSDQEGFKAFDRNKYLKADTFQPLLKLLSQNSIDSKPVPCSISGCFKLFSHFI